MRTAKESKVVGEVRAIRQQLQEAARQTGRKEYHDKLNRRRGWFVGTAATAVHERPAPYGRRSSKG